MSSFMSCFGECRHFYFMSFLATLLMMARIRRSGLRPTGTITTEQCWMEAKINGLV